MMGYLTKTGFVSKSAANTVTKSAQFDLSKRYPSSSCVFAYLHLLLQKWKQQSVDLKVFADEHSNWSLSWLSLAVTAVICQVH